jgi:hypothetical protein
MRRKRETDNKLIPTRIANHYICDGMDNSHPTEQEKNICSKILED